MKIYEKVRPKLRPEYVQTTTLEDRKFKIFNFKGWYLLYKAIFEKKIKANLFIFTQIFTPPIIVLHQCSPLRIYLSIKASISDLYNLFFMGASP